MDMNKYEGNNITPPRGNSRASSALKEHHLTFKQNDISLNQYDVVEFSNQLLNKDDWDNLSRFLTDNQNVHTIDLLGININQQGLRTLGDILLNNSNITTLKLHWNYLLDLIEDFDYFCDAASKSSLNFLYLNNNKINNSLCLSISKMIKNSGNLVLIDLKWNDISNDGAKILITALNQNNSLQELNLTGNKVGEDLVKDINSCCSKNKLAAIEGNNLKMNSANSFRKSLNNLNKMYVTPEKDRAASPIKIVEREKELTEEFKARYDVQLIVNAKLEKKVRELETLISLERSKVNEIAQRYDRQYEEEKKFRDKLEEQILKSKEENKNMIIEKNKIESEYDIKISSLNNDLINLTSENKLLKENLDRSKSTYEERISIIKDQNEKKTESINNSLESVKHEFEKVKRELGDEIKNVSKEYEKNTKVLQESIRNLKMSKEEIERNYINLQREHLDQKLEYENKSRDRESKYISEESKKYDFMVSLYEKRIKALETDKEELNEKNENLYKEINNAKKALNEEQIQNEKKISDLSEEKINLTKSNIILSSDLSKNTSEINAKNALISKFQTDIIELKNKLSDIDKNNTKIKEKLEAESTDEKTKLEKEIKNREVKIIELEKLNFSLKQRLARIETEDMKFSENFKSNLIGLLDKF